MSVRGRISSALDVLLRVPPVFVMDAVLNSSLGLGGENIVTTHYSARKIKADSVDINATSPEFENDHFAYLDVPTLLWFLLYLQAFLGALVVVLLPTQQLVHVYTWLTTLGAVAWSYLCNQEFVAYAEALSRQGSTSLLLELLRLDRGALLRTVANYGLQLVLALLLSAGQGQGPAGAAVLCLAFLAPTLASLCLLPASPLAAAAGAQLLLALQALARGGPLGALAGALRSGRAAVAQLGVYALLEAHWARLRVPQVLRLFWLARMAGQALRLALAGTAPGPAVCELAVRGCDTAVALVGMASVVAALAQGLAWAARRTLLLEGSPERSLGTVAGLLFLVLALQTGLTGLEAPRRLARLYRNLCLLFTAVLHFVQGMLGPLLVSLGASRSGSHRRHARALALSALLVAFPCGFVAYLWRRHAVSPWLLAVTAFSAELTVKVVVSLLVYGLFLVDARRETLWEPLDDYVYYVRAAGSVLEFCFGVFLFFNGAWIFAFESRGTIRAFMMCFHAYFNIWQQARAGCKALARRRAALHKLHSLPEATPQQLRDFDDVCAICFQELQAARVTRCRHFFHGACLRKWLYVRDMCPLCHSTLHNQ
ncbi:protein TRC8 homolog isoform X1 [Ixodes scapularis]|uniref:protein TRC8 homolog isoform X1 n=1 Tax=Ixodes scapularis TaxID=6945 RepID=UPI001A9D1CD9|nr:protein TRC8 homolog isoform X1 [Ixodes scapularis]